MSGASGGRRPAVPAPILTLSFSGAVREGDRPLAVEIPVEVAYADMPFGVMMMTPADLEDFAYGFSLTEGIATAADDVRGVAVETLAEGLRLLVDLAPARLHAHLARRRALAGRTSCGLCGLTDMDQLPRADAPHDAAPPVSLASIGAALAALDGVQPLNATTRAAHGAAWCTPAGAIAAVREDVGRHNALDKLIGARLRERGDPGRGFVLITSRASFEMVEKVATYGARTLVAISAPTSLAVARARALDVTLVGIARRDSVTVFHGADRVVA
jgi:FdhD protein